MKSHSKTMYYLTPIGLFFLVSAPSLPVSAAMYKWVDDHGTTHFTQTPPTGVKASVIAPISPPRNAGQPDEHLQKRLTEFEQRQKHDQQAKQDQETKNRQEKIKTENCDAARRNLDVLQSHGRIKLKEQTGYRVLAEEERNAKIDEAKKYIAEFCHP
jgi:hypothetical protein